MGFCMFELKVLQPLVFMFTIWPSIIWLVWSLSLCILVVLCPHVLALYCLCIKKIPLIKSLDPYFGYCENDQVCIKVHTMVQEQESIIYMVWCAMVLVLQISLMLRIWFLSCNSLMLRMWQVFIMLHDYEVRLHAIVVWIVTSKRFPQTSCIYGTI